MRKANSIRIFKIIILLLLLPIIACGCRITEHRQVPAPTIAPAATPNKLQPYVYERNSGSSKKLLGKCLFVNIFISEPESSFSEDNKERCLDSLRKAMVFLLDKAEEYHKTFEPIYNRPDITLDYEVDFTLPLTFGNYDWARNILEDVFAKYNLQDVLEHYDADNVSYIFNVHNNGHRYALLKGTIPDYDNEIAVLMGVPTIVGYEPVGFDHMTYAHEILHLFGAIDLYYRSDEYRSELAEEQFPSDIMRSTAVVMEEAQICEVIAYLIGWLDELEEQYHLFLN